MYAGVLLHSGHQYRGPDCDRLPVPGIGDRITRSHRVFKLADPAEYAEEVQVQEGQCGLSKRPAKRESKEIEKLLQVSTVTVFLKTN